jgi:uncharacterized protein (DUF697 family)
MDKNNKPSPTLAKANKIINKHMLWAMASAALPLPMIDAIGVMFIQNDMLKQLSKLYDFDYDANLGKSIVSSIIASSSAKGISMLFEKGVDRIAMSLLSGAVTYGMGRFFITFFEKGISLIDIDLKEGEELFNEFFEKGKEVANEKVGK